MTGKVFRGLLASLLILGATVRAQVQTPIPTPLPTPLPTPFPTRTPSVSPSAVPSVSPTNMPTQYPREAVNTKAELSLRPVSGILEGDTEEIFLNYTVSFLSEILTDIESIQVKIERQSRQQRRRFLQEDVLYLDLIVSGQRIIYINDTNTTYSFDDTVLEVFDSFEEEFISILFETGDPFFENIEHAGVPETQAPTLTPTSAPTSEDTGFSLFDLDQVYSIAIVAGGAALIILLLILICCCLRKGRDKDMQYKEQVPEGRSDLESLPNTPLNASSPNSASYYGGSIMQNSTQMDGNSYSYSVEQGVETVISGNSATNGGGRPVPQEIPQLEIPPTAEKKSLLTDQNGVETEISLVPSDLQLTESELAMLPSGLKSNSTEGKAPETRVVIAPPGKLGIIIDTTVEGPVVHRINPGSVMMDKLSPGEIIIAIDEVDCRAMSASAITQLMIKTTGRERKFTVVKSSN